MALSFEVETNVACSGRAADIFALAYAPVDNAQQHGVHIEQFRVDPHADLDSLVACIEVDEPEIAALSLIRVCRIESRPHAAGEDEIPRERALSGRLIELVQNTVFVPEGKRPITVFRAHIPRTRDDRGIAGAKSYGRSRNYLEPIVVMPQASFDEAYGSGPAGQVIEARGSMPDAPLYVALSPQVRRAYV
jgi:hypothetical protein